MSSSAATMLRRVLLLALAAPLLSGAAGIEARLDSHTVYVGDRFSLHLSADNHTAIQQVDLQKLRSSGFDVVGTSQSSQAIYRNGASSITHTQSLDLVAQRAGVYQLQQLLGGVPVARGSKTLTVLAAASRPRSTGISTVADISLEVLPGTHRIGGNLEAVLRFTLREPVDSSTTITHSGADDWEISELQRQGPRTRLGLKRENVYEYRYLFTPLADGKLKLPTFTLSGRAQPLGRRHFQSFSVSTEERTLDILPIPTTWPRGATWLPASKLDLLGEWSGDSQRAKIGEPLTLIIRLRAENLASSRLPSLALPDIDGIRQYSEPAQANSAVHEGVLVSEKVLRVVVVPQRGGEIQLPEMSIPWWDTESDELRQARFTPQPLRVIAPPGQPAPSIAPGEPDAAGEPAPTPPFSLASQPLWFWSGWLVALALVLLLFWMRRSRPAVATAETTLQPRPSGSPPGSAAEGYERLLRWAAPMTPEARLNECGQPQLAEQVRQLERHLYTGAPLPDGFSVAELVRRAQRQKRPNRRPDEALPDLYSR